MHSESYPKLPQPADWEWGESPSLAGTIPRSQPIGSGCGLIVRCSVQLPTANPFPMEGGKLLVVHGAHRVSERVADTCISIASQLSIEGLMTFRSPANISSGGVDSLIQSRNALWTIQIEVAISDGRRWCFDPRSRDGRLGDQQRHHEQRDHGHVGFVKRQHGFSLSVVLHDVWIARVCQSRFFARIEVLSGRLALLNDFTRRRRSRHVTGYPRCGAQRVGP
jgi:hypothetical protein